MGRALVNAYPAEGEAAVRNPYRSVGCPRCAVGLKCLARKGVARTVSAANHRGDLGGNAPLAYLFGLHTHSRNLCFLSYRTSP